MFSLSYRFGFLTIEVSIGLKTKAQIRPKFSVTEPKPPEPDTSKNREVQINYKLLAISVIQNLFL